MRLAQISGITNPSSRFTNNTSLPTDLITFFLRYALAGTGFLFFFRLVAAGFSYMTAAGDPGKIQAATKSLTHAGTGLIIVLAAFFLMQILQTVLGLKII